ncbi:NAD(P)-binding protein [Panus rudis PR-1116 ss-1]|nr:NAD(P)-binding protein [Panus rudis PR-1116 ss-1]
MSLLANIWAFLQQAFPPKSKFSTEKIPDLAGRVAIVTGGNSGIGKETAKALLEHNAKVYIAARSKVKAEDAIKELKEVTGKDALFLELDLGNLAAVRRSAREFLSKEKELHMLFLNAGVMQPPVKMVTSDGYDLQFGTNVIGHFLFTKLLIPTLLAGKETSLDHHSRIITTSSSGAYFCRTIDHEVIRDCPKRRKLSTTTLYFHSKFANVLVAREIAKRYGHQGIISNACNPGNLKTELMRYSPSILQRLAAQFFLWPASYGALTQLWAGTTPEALHYNGEFLIPWARVGRCRPEAYDPELGEQLWNYLEEEVKEYTT